MLEKKFWMLCPNVGAALYIYITVQCSMTYE